ncbi:MAG: phospholipase D-like domain-containing protein [Candidatus Sericytochromatia bacterium]|nr:phospholipase D-like domain-containing protein [Candidatus Sericytochromatia bacterium]
MKVRHIRPAVRAVAALLAVTAGLAGCGSSPSAAGLGGLAVPDGVDAFGAEPDQAGRRLQAYFNDTYGSTIASNEPKARKSATNTDKSFLDLIAKARKSIDGSFYDIADPDAVAALVRASRRGVKVRLTTDTDNMVDHENPSKQRLAIGQLRQAGVRIRDDQRSAIMHNKFMILDEKTVWTGSTNLTTSSLYRHNNNAMVLESETLASRYRRTFNTMFVDGVFGPAGTLSSIGGDGPFHVGSAEVSLYFSPKGGGRDAVVEELRKARKSIHFMTFSLTDKEIGETLVQKSKRGVEVSGVFDRWLAAGQYSLYAPFRMSGMSVVKDGNEALMHHKVILVDGQTIISGSYNYSKNAENANNESFLIIKGDLGLAQRYEREFRRLIYAARNNRPPAFKPKDPELKAEDPTGDQP